MAEALMSEKMLLKLRRSVVSLRQRFRKCDSLSKRGIMMAQLSEMEKNLKECCPHKLVVVDYSQSHDYEENCTVRGQHHCVVCGMLGTRALLHLRRVSHPTLCAQPPTCDGIRTV